MLISKTILLLVFAAFISRILFLFLETGYLNSFYGNTQDQRSTELSPTNPSLLTIRNFTTSPYRSFTISWPGAFFLSIFERLSGSYLKAKYIPVPSLENKFHGIEAKSEPIEMNSLNLTGSQRRITVLQLTNSRSQFCNAFFAIANAVGKVKHEKYDYLLIESSRYQRYLQYIDFELFQRISAIRFLFSFKEVPKDAIVVKFRAFSFHQCIQRITHDVLKVGMRPNAEQKQIAEKKLKILQAHSTTTAAIHLRRAACNHSTILPSFASWFQDWSLCHYTYLNTWNPLSEIGSFCNETLSEIYIGYMNEFPEIDTSSVALYVSSDFGNDGNVWKPFVDTFFDPVRMKTYGVNFTLMNNKEDSMVSDMWVSSLVDIHKGNTHSSCDVIVAMWRSYLRNNSEPYMVPKSCFSNYKLPQHIPYCNGTNFPKVSSRVYKNPIRNAQNNKNS